MDDRTLATAAVRLLRDGVAPRHVRRCIEELRAHRADLCTQLRAQGLDADAAAAEADARLGTVDAFCDAMRARPELRGWAARAPWLVFGIAPLLAFALLGTGLLVLFGTTVDALSPATKATFDASQWRIVGALLVGAVKWALPLGVCAALIAIAWRGRRRPWWPAAGALLTVAFAAAVTMRFIAPEGTAQGQLTVGLGFPPRDVLRLVVLAAVALAGVALLGARERAERLGVRADA